MISASSAAKVILKDLPFEVEVKEGVGGKILIEIDGDLEAANEISIEQNGNKIKISGEKNDSSTIIIGGNSFVVGGSLTVGDNKIIINNVDVTDFVKNGVGCNSSASIKSILVYIPKGSLLKFSNVANLESRVDLTSLVANCSGHGKFKILGKVADAEVELSGQSSGDISSLDGCLSADLSGQTHLKACGKFPRVKISTSGQSSVLTKGDVSGDYTVNMSGQSWVNHVGEIAGDLDKDCSGQARFEQK